MKLRDITEIKSGHHSRGRIEPSEEGSHYLLQARDVHADRLTYETGSMIRFNPDMSSGDCVLQAGDVLFVARGARNYSVLLQDIPDSVLAAASFFIIRVSAKEILSTYLCWYLNQAPVEHYLIRHTGRGVHMPVVRRSVLENLDIPLPPIETQRAIVELDALMREEEDLLKELAEKRRRLIATVCLQKARDRQ